MTTNEGIATCTSAGTVELPWIRRSNPGAMPLVMINGLGSPRVSYEDGFVEALVARGFEVVLFDNRDAGRATATSGGYVLADMANDAIAVLDAVGYERAHVFGMSMGGMIVQQLGIDHADRLLSITSLMSTTGNPEFGTSSSEARKGLVTPSPTEREAWLAHRIATEQIWASPSEWTSEKSRAKGELMFDYGVQPRSTVHQYNAIMNSPEREGALAEVTVPTLVLHGNKDTLIHFSGGQRTAAVMPNASYIELDGMGHDLPAEYWSTIADEVANHAETAVG